LRCEIRIPAKINLWLEVVAKREDGFHELSTLMLPIGVYDHLELLLRSEGGIELDCNYPGVPSDANNLAFKAAQLFLHTAELADGVGIHLEKNIPVGAGLGGGSADAAATLIGLNSLAPKPLAIDVLHSLAHRLGADVAFFLYGRPALATGIGEKLQHIEGLPSYPVVLIKPPSAVSTHNVYRSLTLTRGRSHISIGRLLGSPWTLRDVMLNDLETVTVVELPVLARIKQWLLDHGALGALMSGSGPTVFGIFSEKGTAGDVAARARQAWKDCWIMACETLDAEC
jgi:4-diphosphocytidyl-2-C-methyl-D-erythritol kinase